MNYVLVMHKCGHKQEKLIFNSIEQTIEYWKRGLCETCAKQDGISIDVETNMFCDRWKAKLDKQ